MDTTKLLYVLAALVVLVLIGALFFPERFRVLLKFMGFHAELEGGRGSAGTGQDAPHGERRDADGVVWEAKAEDAAGAQVAVGVGNVQSIGAHPPEPTGLPGHQDVPVPSLRASAKDSPDAQVAAGTGNRQHRDAPEPAEGDAPGNDA